ncbi:unnamed protein product [Durusdinium trenchii]|uniref:Uncharacterized protein n=1 Tax=Durusdinium trenchii TaxID=1381693 RepID=A0ABP0SD74_9DINO
MAATEQMKDWLKQFLPSLKVTAEPHIGDGATAWRTDLKIEGLVSSFPGPCDAAVAGALPRESSTEDAAPSLEPDDTTAVERSARTEDGARPQNTFSRDAVIAGALPRGAATEDATRS